jgi:chromosome segregation ATPase
MKVAEKIIAQGSGDSLQKPVVKLEEENSQLKATAVQSAKTIAALQRSVDTGIEDYDLFLEGNKSLLADHNELRYRSEDLESELAKVRSSAAESIAVLEARIKSAEAHNMDVAAASEKRLKDFESEFIKVLQGCTHCMNAAFEASEVYACRYLRRSLWPLISFAGCPQR